MSKSPQPNTRSTVDRAIYQVVRFLLIIGVLAAISISVVLKVAQMPATYTPDVPGVLVDVRAGTSGQALARRLEQQGLIRDERLFRLVLRLMDAEQRIQVGVYRFNANMRPQDIVRMLIEGRYEMERVVIPEGYELKQIAAVLDRLGLANGERFLELAQDATSVYGDDLPFDLPIASLEGYLFPDTYFIGPGQSEEALIRLMVRRFVQVANEHIVPELERTGLNLHEVVTLASIVEKEIRLDRERPVVAGVYLNRLAIDMRLQADPTVRYVMTEERDRVLYRDLEIDSPYNTYRHAGLPPGPIASPGLASMQAVLNPADVDYLFFVATGDGSHQFSRTYEEHLQARRDLGR